MRNVKNSTFDVKCWGSQPSTKRSYSTLREWSVLLGNELDFLCCAREMLPLFRHFCYMMRNVKKILELEVDIFCTKMDLNLPFYRNKVYCWEMNWISCVVPGFSGFFSCKLYNEESNKDSRVVSKFFFVQR